MTLARLFSACAFGHDAPLMTRNASQEAVWQCSRCLAELGPVLASAVVDGPAKAPSEVLGACTAKAQRVRAVPSVSTWRKQS